MQRLHIGKKKQLHKYNVSSEGIKEENMLFSNDSGICVTDD